MVAQKLIADFDSLPAEDKQAVAKEILRRLPAFDSGALDDQIAALAGDQLADMLREEESDSKTR